MAEQRNIGEICTRVTAFATREMPANEAAQLMRDQHVGCLVVVVESDKGRQVAGMITDRDLALAVVAPAVDARSAKVGDIMSKDVVVCRSDASIADALALMRSHGVRRLPVTDEQNALIGIVSFDDLLRIVAEDMQSFTQIIDSERKREMGGHA